MQEVISCGIQNPSSADKESVICYLEFRIHSMESRIWLTYVERLCIYLVIYLFIYSMLTGSKASLSRWLAFARSNRRHGNQRWWIENCYTGLYFAYSIWARLTATVVIDYRSIDKLWVCLWRVEWICNVLKQQRSIVIKLSESCLSLIQFSPISDNLESSYLRK